MPLTADQLTRRLRSTKPNERLEAARYFAANSTPADEQILRETLAKERVLWIKSALRRALARISPTPEQEVPDRFVDRGDLPEGFAAQVYSEALETTTSQLMHEIEPIIGGLKLAAQAEIENFDDSATRRSLDRLDLFLEALSRFRRAASAPKTEEFRLDELLQNCIQEIKLPDGVIIQKSGPQPCVVEGDPGLISLAFANGLRNAIEATAATDELGLPVAVAWQTTDVDNWISIVDVGVGFKGNIQRAFDMGTTTKAGHLGMGLAIAHQSISSMDGRIILVPNERGVRFEIRWPKKVT